MEVEDFSPRISVGGRRSSCALPFSPLMIIDGISRKRFSYNMLPEEPLKLTVLKLDGSCFDIEVTKTATIEELKLAVEAVFSHMPKKGPGRISWPHVWGHFCLCYDGQKLVTETDHIRNYGIKDGDQIHFIRHLSTSYNLTKKQQKKRAVASKQHNMSLALSTSCKEKEGSSEEDDAWYDIENGRFQIYENEDENIVRYDEFRLGNFFRGWFSYYSLASTGRMRGKGTACPSRFSHGFLDSCTKILQICGGKRYRLRNTGRED